MLPGLRGYRNSSIVPNDVTLGKHFLASRRLLCVACRVSQLCVVHYAWCCVIVRWDVVWCVVGCLCRAVSCRAVLRLVLLCVVSRRAVSVRVVSVHFISFRAVPLHLVSCRFRTLRVLICGVA